MSSGPASGATLSSISVGSTLDVAVFSTALGALWTFNLDTSTITGMTTYSFTSSSTVSDSAGLVTASGSVAISKVAAAPEPMTLWSLLLVLVSVFFVCWRQGRSASSPSPAL